MVKNFPRPLLVDTDKDGSMHSKLRITDQRKSELVSLFLYALIGTGAFRDAVALDKIYDLCNTIEEYTLLVYIHAGVGAQMKMLGETM